MTTWTSSPLQAPPQTEDVAELRTYLKKTINEFAIMMKNLDHVLNGNIDLKNVRAQSIDATRLNVDKLSAISADMGELTAGIIRGIEIYGSKISTNETGYPRAEMSISENLFKVATDEDHTLIVTSSYNGAPGIYFATPDNNLVISADDVESGIGCIKTLRFEVGDDLILQPVLGEVVIYNTSKLRFTQNGTMNDIVSGIYSQLGSLSDRITALGG